MQIKAVDSQGFSSRQIGLNDLYTLKQSFNNVGKVMFYNVDTTHGFMDQYITVRANGIKDGFPVQGADKIVPALRKLKEILAGRMFKLETVDAHTFSDPEIQKFKNISDIHSEKGTRGAEMIPETVWGNPSAIVEVEQYKNDVPGFVELRKIMRNNGIIRLEKNEIDPLKYGDGTTGMVVDNKKAIQLFDNLKMVGAEIALIAGVADEYCVKAAVAACKRFGITPIVIEDAVKDAGNPALNNPLDPVYNDVMTITTDKIKTWLG